MSENKKISKVVKIIIALIVLAALIVGGIFIYSEFGPKKTEGEKQITIEVVDNEGKSTVYELRTDAKSLQEAMDEAEGLTYSGTEGQYGLMIDTVNGVKADYSVDQSYWGFYVNGEYCNYGIKEQPVNDGDEFRIAYTTD
jgi:hypothetical protein